VSGLADRRRRLPARVPGRRRGRSCGPARSAGVPDGVQGGLAGGGHVGALELFSDHVRFQRAFSL